MSIEPQHSSDRKPPLRYNHGPSILPQDLILQESGLNSNLLNILREELENRRGRLLTARNTYRLKTAQRAAAEFRLSAATGLKNRLSNTEREYELSIVKLEVPVMGLQSDTEIRSSNLLGVTDILAELQAIVTKVASHLETATKTVRLSQEEVIRSLEEQQGALEYEADCSAIVKGLEEHIKSIAQINALRADRSIWRIPETIWQQIFGVVVEASSINISEEEWSGPTRIPPLTLAAVCYTWRMIALSHHDLWRNIYIVSHKFTEADALSIKHCVGRSGGQALRIMVNASHVTSSDQMDLIASCFTGPNPVECLTIKGGTGVKGVAESLSKVIGSPRDLVFEVSVDFVFQRLKLPQTISPNLRRLTLKNCAPSGFVTERRKRWTCRLVNLHMDPGAEVLDWTIFHAWALPLITAAKCLDILAEFSNTTLPVGSRQPNLLQQLVSIRTNIPTLILFHNARISTPNLQSLVVVTSDKDVDAHAWRAWAEDVEGGGNITSVTVEEGDGWGNWGTDSGYIRALPQVKSISLESGMVNVVLTALCESATVVGNDERPLKGLEVLTISNYPWDGEEILDFACRYVPDAVGSESQGHTLKVRLHNCPGISEGILQQLKDIGSI